MTDSITTRVVEIATTGSDLSKVLPFKVAIDVSVGLPFYTAKPATLSGRTLTTVDQPTVAVVSRINILTDRRYYESNNQERFIHLTEVTSTLTNSTVSMYFDRLYSDILIVPDVGLIVDNQKLHSTGKQVTIAARSVGGNSDTSYCYETYSVTKESSRRLPVTNATVTSKVHQLNLPGIANNGTSGYLETMINGSVNVATKENKPVTVIDLGLVSDLFTQTTERVSAYSLVQTHINAFSLVCSGTSKLEPTNNFYIPIIF